MTLLPRLAPTLALALWPTLALAQTPFRTITSSGAPLRNLFVGNEGSIQIDHVLDLGAFQVYPSDSRPGDYGTVIAVGGLLFGPDFNNHESGSASGNLSNAANYTPYLPLSQTATMGSGAPADPRRIVTTYGAGTTGLVIAETTVYVAGQESFFTEIRITNTGTQTHSGFVYRAADCYLGGSDSGYGFFDSATGAIACSENPDNMPAGRVEQWLPLTPDSHYFQARYSIVWDQIATGTQFPDTCTCATQLDNGAGISWAFTVAPGASTVRSHLTTFSVLGALPIVTSKTADASQVAPGGTTGYMIRLDNPNMSVATLTAIVDLLPNGFSYVPGSTSGATTINPTIVGQTLTWAGPFMLVAQGMISLHFNVLASTSTGTYFNNAVATAQGQLTVAPTGDTAPVEVLIGGPNDGGPSDLAGDGGAGGDVAGGDGGPGTDSATGDGASSDAESDGGGGADSAASDAAGSDTAANDSGPSPDAGGGADSGNIAPDLGTPGDDAGEAPDLGKPPGGGDGDGDGDGDMPSDDGCNCRAARHAGGDLDAWWIALGFLALMRPRRARVGGRLGVPACFTAPGIGS